MKQQKSMNVNDIYTIGPHMRINLNTSNYSKCVDTYGVHVDGVNLGFYMKMKWGVENKQADDLRQNQE